MGHLVKTKTLSFLSSLPDAIVRSPGERHWENVLEPINLLLRVSRNKLSTLLGETLKLGIYLVTRRPLRIIDLVFPLLMHINYTGQF